MNINHIDIKKKEDCTGCGACTYVCPKKAIKLHGDEEGFLEPLVDIEKCTECGLCVVNCHAKNEIKCTSMDYEQYAIKHRDEAVRAKSRSGGVFTAISDYFLEKGGVVFGAVLNKENFTVEHVCAHTPEERDRMCGSKYVQSNMKDTFLELEKQLNSGKNVLFTGTPCQVSAVAKIFKRDDYPNLLLCDFVCHGVPSEMLLSHYIRWCSQKYKGRVTDFLFRNKQRFSWESHVEDITVQNRHIYSKKYAELFSKSVCLRESCYSCKYTTINRIADFTIADYWGIDQILPEFNDGKGVSLLIARSESAKKIFNCIKVNLVYENTIEHEPTHYNLKRPTARPTERTEFYEDLSSKGFGFVSQKYGDSAFLRRIRNRIFYNIR